MSTTKFKCPNCDNPINHELPLQLIGDDCTEIICPNCPAIITVELDLKVKLSYTIEDKFEDYKAYKYDSRSR